MHVKKFLKPIAWLIQSEDELEKFLSDIESMIDHWKLSKQDAKLIFRELQEIFWSKSEVISNKVFDEQSFIDNASYIKSEVIWLTIRHWDKIYKRSIEKDVNALLH